MNKKNILPILSVLGAALLPQISSAKSKVLCDNCFSDSITSTSIINADTVSTADQSKIVSLAPGQCGACGGRKPMCGCHAC